MLVLEFMFCLRVILPTYCFIFFVPRPWWIAYFYFQEGSDLAVYVTADARNLAYAHADRTQKLMQDLKNNFKNIQFKNMFFKNIREFCGPDGLKEWETNAYLWLYKYGKWEPKSEEECKQLFKNWIKNQIQQVSANAIVMMDEMCVLAFCNREKFHQDPSNITLYLSFLEEYENVKFVICRSQT